MHINSLTNAEEQLMQLFWKMQSFLLKEVMEQLPEPKPHQNTISTYLKILVEKEFLTAEKEGRIFRYHVAVPFENYRNLVLKNLIRDYFSDSSFELLKIMIDEKMLDSSALSRFFEIKATVIPIKKEEKKKQTTHIIIFIKFYHDALAFLFQE